MASQMISVRFSDEEMALLKSCQKVTLADGTEITLPLATLIRDIVTQSALKIKHAQYLTNCEVL
jgi:hypothetical protein